MKFKELVELNQSRPLVIMRQSPKRVISASRNYRQIAQAYSEKLHAPVIDESHVQFQKKRQLNEHYSFLLGKLDRSKSNSRSKRSFKAGKAMGDISVDHAYDAQAVSRNIERPKNKTIENNRVKSSNRSQRQSVSPNRQSNHTPLIKVQPVSQFASINNDLDMMLQRDSQALSRSVMSKKSSHSSLRKSAKKVEFAPDLNNVINYASVLSTINQRKSSSRSQNKDLDRINETSERP